MAGPLRDPRLRAAGLVLPLVAFIGVTFVAPVATMLVRSVYDPVVADALPETLAALNGWDGAGAPAEAVYAAAARELIGEGHMDAGDFPDFEAETGLRSPGVDFIDGISFDAREPNAYLRQFAIGNKD